NMPEHLSEKQTKKGLFLRQQLAQARTLNDVYDDAHDNQEKNSKLSRVFYSRTTTNEKIKPEEREKKQIDYFALTRVSDKNQVRVGGDVTISARVDQGRNAEPVVGFSFNSRGADKFYQVTSNNQIERPQGGCLAGQRYR